MKPNVISDAITRAYDNAMERRRIVYENNVSAAINHITRRLNEYNAEADDLEIDLSEFNSGNPEEGMDFVRGEIDKILKHVRYHWKSNSIIRFNFCIQSFGNKPIN